MRPCRRDGRAPLPRLERDDRLLPGSPGRGLDEPPSLFNGLQVERDDARLRVVREVVDEVDLGNVHPVPEVHGPCDSDPLVGGQIDEARHKRAALGDDGNGPSPRPLDSVPGNEERVDARRGRKNPQAVGADDRDVVGVGQLAQLALALPARLARLAEAGRQHDRVV
ncbi:MAG: hypothetical protein HYR98_07920, partial [Nitrospirae bacterium]|nr:hypothetical protein [Nitrospirota bacterium]